MSWYLVFLSFLILLCLQAAPEDTPSANENNPLVPASVSVWFCFCVCACVCVVVCWLVASRSLFFCLSFLLSWSRCAYRLRKIMRQAQTDLILLLGLFPRSAFDWFCVCVYVLVSCLSYLLSWLRRSIAWAISFGPCASQEVQSIEERVARRNRQ